MELLSAAVPRRAYVRRLLVDLFAFTACAFALTWIVVGLYIWNADAATRALGPLRLGAPAFYLAVYAPSLAAIAVTCARYGRAGLANLFRALFRIRAGWGLVATSLLSFPGLWRVVPLLGAALSGGLESFAFP